MSSNQQASAESLYVKNEELENYFANTIIPQLFVDADFILRKFTPPAMKTFQLSEEDLGKNIEGVKDNIKYPTVIQNIQEVISTGEILEKEIQTTDKRWYQMNILPYKVRKENRTNGVIITFVDITQRINILRDLEKLNAEHETLMFALSHDIKQPLTTLSLLGDLLDHAFEKQDRPMFKKLLEKHYTASKSVKVLVDGFVDANDLGPEWERKLDRINIQTTVDDITTALRSEYFSHRNLTTDFEATEIIFSRNNLRSIVFNLLNNAVKYRHPRRSLQVHICTRKIDGFVLLQVQDNGLGIAVEDQEIIFRKGQRVPSGVEGTGMGLYIIRSMLQSMGSRISLESEPGEGSRFSVFFREKPL